MMSPLFGEDDADMSLMMEAFAEAWVVSNPMYTFMSDDADFDQMLGNDEEEEEGEVGPTNDSKGGAETDDAEANGENKKTSLEKQIGSEVEVTPVCDKHVEQTEEETTKVYEELKSAKDQRKESTNLVEQSDSLLSGDPDDKIVSSGNNDNGSAKDFDEKQTDDGKSERTSPSCQDSHSPSPPTPQPTKEGRLSLDVVVEDSSNRSSSTHAQIDYEKSSLSRTYPQTLIPPALKIRDLISFLLLKLGYLRNKAESPVADAYLVVKQWSPISLKTLCKSSSQSLGEVTKPFASLEDLSLKIVIESWKTKDLVFKWNNDAVRTTLSSLLRHYSQKRLAALCPFSQAYISMIARDKDSVVISEAKCLEFGSWFEKFTKKVISSAVATAEDVCALGNKTKMSETRLKAPSILGPHKGALLSASKRKESLDETPPLPPPPLSKMECGLDSKPNQISFHASLELPLLRKWFSASPTPSEAQLADFADQLNGAEWRQSTDRIRVTKDKLRNWWKNERARRKRQRDKEKDLERESAKRTKPAEEKTKT